MLEQHTELLTEEQIDQLLSEAESRLRERAGLEVTKASDLPPQKRKPIPKLQHGLDQIVQSKAQNGLAKTGANGTVSVDQKRLGEGLRPINDPVQSKKINDITDAGPQWFNLPKTELTPQLKRDLQLIEMRNVLDPYRHYKKNNRKGKVPTFSQVGTVIEGPTEFFSGRINKRDRSQNFVEEAMKTEAENGRFKRKYSEIQDQKTSGKKAHYKKLMAKRKKS